MQTPKKIGIIAKHGENLEYVAPGSRKTAESRNWAVVFIGGRKKMASNFVESQSGCPTWNCEVTIDLVSASDPVVMLVIDAKRRHVGQVIVPLSQIPQTGPPNFDMSRLHCGELEPTKKNSTPRGRLFYWIWAIDYWPPGTKVKPHKSLRGSLSNLGRTLGSRSSKAGSMVSGAYSESNISGSGNFLNAPPVWNAAPPPGSYNPMEEEDQRSGMSNIRNSSESDNTRLSNRPPMYLSVAQLNTTQTEQDAESIGAKSTGKSSGFRNLKKKMSRSIHNLQKAAAKKAGGDSIYGDGKSSIISGISTRDQLQFPDSTSPGSRVADGSMVSLSRDSYMADGAPRQQNGEELRSTASNATLHPPSLLPYRSNDGQTEGKRSVVGGIWGLHAEERSRKPIEDMSRREAVDYAIQLERSLREVRSELTSVKNKYEALYSKAEADESDLNAVRSELASLRNRLLQDDLTQYLEVPSNSRKPLVSLSEDLSSSRDSYFMSRKMSSGVLSNGPSTGDGYQSKLFGQRLSNFGATETTGAANGSTHWW